MLWFEYEMCPICVDLRSLAGGAILGDGRNFGMWGLLEEVEHWGTPLIGVPVPGPFLFLFFSSTMR
jgi:hypothetical protein